MRSAARVRRFFRFQPKWGSRMLCPAIYVQHCDEQIRLLRFSYIEPRLFIYWKLPRRG